MNEVPISLFIFLMLILFYSFLLSLSGTGIISIFSSFVSIALSFILAKISINGMLVYNFGHISSTDVMIYGEYVIQNGAQSLLFTMTAIFMTIRVIMILIEQYKDAYSEVTE